MTKYLRHLSFRGFQESPSEVSTIPVGHHWERNAWNGIDMYERYALPVACTNLAKLNICASLNGTLPPAEPVCGVATCWIETNEDPLTFDTVRSQQDYLLKLVHSAVLSVAPYYGFGIDSFILAYQNIIDGDFNNEYCIGPQRSSPDRLLKAQILYRFDNRPQSYLLIRDKNGSEIQRILFAHSGPTSFGVLRWISDNEICVWHKNNRDHWRCTLSGTIRFVYPPADTGDAHALYRLATMLLDGQGLIPDYDSGLALLQQAAHRGYKHAQRRLEREFNINSDAERPPR